MAAVGEAWNGILYKHNTNNEHITKVYTSSTCTDSMRKAYHGSNITEEDGLTCSCQRIEKQRSKS